MATDLAVTEASKLYQKAHKIAKGGLFSKGNPEEAEKVFNEAKKKIRFLKPQTEASLDLLLHILEETAECQYAMNLYNSSAQTMEDACRLTQEMKEKFGSKRPYFLQKAAYYYQLNSQFELACKSLQRAAEITGETDVDGALKLYDQCVSIEENENRYQLCHEFFDAAVKFCIERRLFKDATSFLQRQIVQYENDVDKFIKRIYRNIISLMIINFALKDVKNAQQIYYDAVNKYGPSHAEQEFATKLLTVFEKADDQGLKLLQKEQDFALYLINSVAQLGKKLDMDGIHPLTIVDETKQIKEDVIKKIEEEEDMKEQLQSDIQNANLNEDGAPDLLD